MLAVRAKPALSGNHNHLDRRPPDTSQTTDTYATAVSGGPAVDESTAGIPSPFVTRTASPALAIPDASGSWPWDIIPPDTNVAHKSAT